MLKTYRIIPLAFILFLFGFTLNTVAPVNAQTVDQLIERIEKLEAFHAGDTATPSLTQPSSVNSAVTSSDPSGSYADQIRATIRQTLPLCQSYMIAVEQMNKITADPRRREYEGLGDERDKLYQSTLARLRSTTDVFTFCTSKVWFTHDELRGK